MEEVLMNWKLEIFFIIATLIYMGWQLLSYKVAIKENDKNNLQFWPTDMIITPLFLIFLIYCFFKWTQWTIIVLLIFFVVVALLIFWLGLRFNREMKEHRGDYF